LLRSCASYRVLSYIVPLYRLSLFQHRPFTRYEFASYQVFQEAARILASRESIDVGWRM
jgi:hypothetical protein